MTKMEVVAKGKIEFSSEMKCIVLGGLDPVTPL